MKETQQDFGLLDQAATAAAAERGLEKRLEYYERPLYHPLRARAWASEERGSGAPVISPPPAAADAPQGLGSDALDRKRTPIYSGVVKYFPKALACVSRVSYVGNEQHHPGTPLHWDRTKSRDHLDCVLRHATDFTLGKVDEVVTLPNGVTMTVPELGKVAWRALAALECYLNGEGPNG